MKRPHGERARRACDPEGQRVIVRQMRVDEVDSFAPNVLGNQIRVAEKRRGILTLLDDRQRPVQVSDPVLQVVAADVGVEGLDSGLAKGDGFEERR